MGAFGGACRETFPRILSLLGILGGGTAQLRFVAYGDYDTPQAVVEVSGADGAALPLLRSTCIRGGGDAPEAVKTALCEVLRLAGHAGGVVDRLDCTVQHGVTAVPGNAEHVVFLFTDAPPHSSCKDAHSSTPRHIQLEQERLGGMFDWFTIRGHLATRHIPVVTFVPARAAGAISHWYAALGPVVPVADATADGIAAVTLAVFEHMIGQASPTTVPVTTLMAAPQHVSATTSEEQLAKAQGTSVTVETPPAEALASPTLTRLLGNTLATLPRKLKQDEAYRRHVIELIAPLLTAEHARSLMTVAVLGQIWRALAAFQRHDEAVARLCDSFSVAVQTLADPQLSEWLLSTYSRCAPAAAHVATLQEIW